MKKRQAACFGNHNSFSRISLFLAITSMTFATALHAASRPDKEGKTIRSLGIKWLVEQQDAQTGAYGTQDAFQPGKTALVVWVMATCEREYQVVDGPYMSEAVTFLLKSQGKDGAFGGGDNKQAKIFNSGMAVLALSSLKTAKEYANAITKAKAFLAGQGIEEVTAQAVWPKEINPLAKRLFVAQQLIAAGKGGDWMTEGTAMIVKAQDRTDDTRDDYGKVAVTTKVGLEGDPTVTTAIGVKIADLIKSNFKKLSK